MNYCKGAIIWQVPGFDTSKHYGKACGSFYYLDELIVIAPYTCTVKAPVFGTLNSAISNFQT